jgi:uncharacterized membrane protein
MAGAEGGDDSWHAVPGQYMWIVGVFLAALASLISNLGVTLQKLLHNQTLEKGGDRSKYYKHPLWWLGVSLVVLGSLADFAALSFSPQSMIAPLGSLTLVSNVIFAPYLLKERITRRDLVGTALIIGGCCVTVLFADHSSNEYTPSELFELFANRGYQVYCVIVAIMIVGLRSYIHEGEKLDMESTEYEEKRKYMRFAYPASAGVVGAQSVLFAKCTVELLTANFVFKSGNMFVYPQTWIILTLLGITIFCQIKWLNEGLQQFDASYTVPVFQAFWILLSVISGLMFYKEIDGMNTIAKVFFFVGIIVTIYGVSMLSHRRVPKSTTRGRPTGSEMEEFGLLEVLDNEDPESGLNPTGGVFEDNSRISRDRLSLRHE